MRKIFLAASAAFLAFSATAFAQTAVIVEPGPGELPGEVRTYVMEQEVPSVVYDGDVMIGRVLPEVVELRVVEGYDGYAYTVVNERRVIVDPQTRTVIQVLE